MSNVDMIGGRIPDRVKVRDLKDILKAFSDKDEVFIDIDNTEEYKNPMIQLKVRGYSKDTVIMEDNNIKL